MKILLFIDSLGPGGAQRQLVGLATFLKELGYDVTVACYHDNRFYVDKLLSCGVPYVYLKKAKSIPLRIWFVARYIRKIKPNVVISYLETPSICTCIAKVFNHNFKLIVSERNTTQHTGRNEKIRFNLFRLADYIVPNAYSQEAYMRTNFPKLADKIVTIPNFVDLKYFMPRDGKQRRTVPEVLVVATIWASKNTLGFIGAVALLKEKGYHFHVSWYGKDNAHLDYYNQCQEKIARLGVDNYLTLKEKTTKIRDYYQDADYFCLPSFYEGTPNVIGEAMACGLPVVCSKVCDNPQYVVEGENGFLFDPNDAESICRAFEKVFALTEQEYRDYCIRSRSMAEKKLSKEKFVQSYIEIIES